MERKISALLNVNEVSSLVKKKKKFNFNCKKDNYVWYIGDTFIPNYFKELKRRDEQRNTKLK